MFAMSGAWDPARRVLAVTVTAVVFDLGGVLVRWDPRLVFAPLLPGEDVDAFLEEVGFAQWNHAQDAGRPWDEAVASHAARYPHRAEVLAAYPERVHDSVPGMYDDTVALAEELRAGGVRLVALTNWSAQTFAMVRPRLTFLDGFDGVLVSGEEGMAKPDPRIFQLLVARYDLDPSATVYVDDAPANVAAAERLGFRAHLHEGEPGLRAYLVEQGVLPDGARPAAGPRRG